MTTSEIIDSATHGISRIGSTERTYYASIVAGVFVFVISILGMTGNMQKEQRDSFLQSMETREIRMNLSLEKMGNSLEKVSDTIERNTNVLNELRSSIIQTPIK